MVDMAKMKEEALQRKRQHEEKELKKQLERGKRPARRSSASSRDGARAAGRSNARGAGRNPSAQRALAQRSQPKKRKRSVSRWVLDILLVLGALLVVLLMLSPFR